MAKSRDAFRTISEVSDALETPAHVLRFWESKFSQIKPVKRAGGRRYYRPDDVSLLIGIKHLLHDQGMTIKGAQKLLREKGVKHVVGIGEDLDSPEQTMAPTLVETKPDATVQAVTDIMQSQKTDETQTEMFDAGESDIEVIEDRPTPQLKIISAKHVPDEAPETKAMDAPSDRPPPATDNTPQATKDDAVPISALSPFAKPKPLLPSNPAARADMPARCLAAATRAKPERVKENVAEIAPLISRLIALRDEMRHPW